MKKPTAQPRTSAPWIASAVLVLLGASQAQALCLDPRFRNYDRCPVIDVEPPFGDDPSEPTSPAPAPVPAPSDPSSPAPPASDPSGGGGPPSGGSSAPSSASATVSHQGSAAGQADPGEQGGSISGARSLTSDTATMLDLYKQYADQPGSGEIRKNERWKTLDGAGASAAPGSK